MYCRKCGKRNPDGAQFCAYCGAELYKYETAAEHRSAAKEDTRKSGSPVHPKKPNRKPHFLLLIVTILTAVVCLATYFFVHNSENLNKENVSEETTAESASESGSSDNDINQNQNVTTYSNGDYLYTPPEECLAYDEDKTCVYFNNILNVYLLDELSSSEADSLASTVDGVVAGKVSGNYINILQIKVEASDIDTLEKQAMILMKSEAVLYACYTVPMEIEDSTESSDTASTTSALWGGDTDIGIEAAPGGKDWWAEAIGAYSAWDYSDQTEPVAVGIVDNGFWITHEDLVNSSGNPIIQMLNENTLSTKSPGHGTEVAGLICAQNNNIGIRGVADQANILAVDWTDAQGDSQITTSPDDNISYLTSTWLGEYFSQMADYASENNMPLVINNSWAHTLLSEEGYRKEEYGNDYDAVKWAFERILIKFTDSYDAYISMSKSESNRTAFECEMIIIQMMMKGCDNFIVVQCAGNGYDNKGPGVDCKYSGCFDAIDEDVFNLFHEETKEWFAKKGITYDTIKNHIIVVGAVEKPLRDGSYKLTSFSNFGHSMDLCAPGEDIYTTTLDHSYTESSGTSFSAPIVSGSAAYLWSLDRDLNAAEVKALLINNAGSATGVSKEDKGNTYKMLNLGASVRALLKQKELSEASKLLQGLWITGSSSGDLWYINGDQMTLYTHTDPNADPGDLHYSKGETVGYSIERLNESDGSGYRIVQDTRSDGKSSEYWFVDDNPDVLEEHWYENGVLQYSASGSLMRVTDFTIDDLISIKTELTDYIGFSTEEMESELSNTGYSYTYSEGADPDNPYNSAIQCEGIGDFYIEDGKVYKVNTDNDGLTVWSIRPGMSISEAEEIADDSFATDGDEDVGDTQVYHYVNRQTYRYVLITVKDGVVLSVRGGSAK